MKNFVKKIVSLILVCCCVFSLGACSSSSNNTNEDSSSNQDEKTLPTSIVLSVTNLKLKVGDTYQLFVTVLPAQTVQSVTFSSANEQCAVVSSMGLVTAIGQGQTAIYAKTSNDIIAVCSIEVAVQTGDLVGILEYSNFNGKTFIELPDSSSKVHLIPINIEDFPSDYTTSGTNYSEYGIYITTSNNLGEYEFRNIPVGSYKMIVYSKNTKWSQKQCLDIFNDIDTYMNQPVYS